MAERKQTISSHGWGSLVVDETKWDVVEDPQVTCLRELAFKFL